MSIIISSSFEGLSSFDLTYYQNYRCPEQFSILSLVEGAGKLYLTYTISFCFTLYSAFMESGSAETVLCSSCSRPWQSAPYKTGPACCQKAHRQRLRRRLLATGDEPMSPSIQPPLPSTLCPYLHSGRSARFAPGPGSLHGTKHVISVAIGDPLVAGSPARRKGYLLRSLLMAPKTALLHQMHSVEVRRAALYHLCGHTSRRKESFNRRRPLPPPRWVNGSAWTVGPREPAHKLRRNRRQDRGLSHFLSPTRSRIPPKSLHLMMRMKRPPKLHGQAQPTKTEPRKRKDKAEMIENC